MKKKTLREAGGVEEGEMGLYIKAERRERGKQQRLAQQTEDRVRQSKTQIYTTMPET